MAKVCGVMNTTIDFVTGINHPKSFKAYPSELMQTVASSVATWTTLITAKICYVSMFLYSQAYIEDSLCSFENRIFYYVSKTWWLHVYIWLFQA